MLTNMSWRWPAEAATRFSFWTPDLSEDQIEGERLLEDGNFVQAEIRLTKAIVDSERRRQPSKRRIQLRLELAEAQHQQFQHGDTPVKLTAAEGVIREALDIALRTQDKQAQVECLDVLAEILADAGKYEVLEQVVEDANRAEAGVSGAEPIRWCRRMQLLGLARRKSGRLGDAVEILEEAAKACEKILGPEHVETAGHWTELGSACHFLGQHAKAQKFLARAIKVHESQRGLDSQEAVHDLSLLTGSYEAAGDLDAAADLQERVLSLRLRAVGVSLDEIAEAQFALAGLYIKWNRPARARELLMEAIGTFRRTKGARLAAAHETLGFVEERCTHFQSALTELANAGKVWETLQDEHTPELIRNLEYRAALMDRMKMRKDADYLRQRALALTNAARWAHAS